MQTAMRHESLRTTLVNAYALTVVARVCDVLFFLGLFSAFRVEEVGLYSWTAAIMAFFAITLELGLSQTLVREFTQRSFGLISAAIPNVVIRLPILAVGAVVYLFWVWTWGPSLEEYEALGLAGAIQVLMLGEGYCLAWMKANAYQSVANVLSALDPVGRLVIFGILVYGVGLSGVVNLLTGILGLHLVLLVAVVIIAMRLAQGECSDEPNARSLFLSSRTFFRAGLTLGLIGLVGVAQNRLDWLLVSTYVGNVELASYSLANKAYEMLVLFMGVAMLTAYPWICRRDADALFRMRMNIMLFSLIILGTTLSLGSSLYLSDLLSWLWERKYEGARLLLLLLLPVAAISTVVVILYYQLVAREQERSLLVISLVSTGIQLLVNLWLIPRIGAVGAVAGMATLASVNIVCLSLLGCQTGIVSANQIRRTASYLIVMFGFAFLLWRTDVPLQWGGPALMTLGLGAGFSILLPRREQRWLKAFVRRESWDRLQLRAGEA